MDEDGENDGEGMSAPDYPFEMDIEWVASLDALSQEVEAIMSSRIDWSDKYALLFAAKRHEQAAMCFEQIGLDFEWVDPEEEGEADCRAFAQAFGRRMASLAPFFDAVRLAARAAPQEQEQASAAGSPRQRPRA